jgi:signal transduction histidine kinase
MPKVIRIALVEAGDSPLAEDLEGLSSSPRVRRFSTLFGDPEPIRRFRPTVLMIQTAGLGGEEIGAMRLLRALLPAATMVLVGDAADEVDLRRLGERFQARLLLRPYTHGELAGSMARAVAGNSRPSEEVFLDLARGIADEINNPLLFISGHLQLLHQHLDPGRDRARLDEVKAAQEGVQRIVGTVEKMRLLSRAASLDGTGEPVDLVPLLTEAVARAERGTGRRPRLSLPRGAEQGTVTGHRALLEAALGELCQLAIGFMGAGCQVSLSLARLVRGPRLRMRVQGDGLEDWQLPRTFEPYFLNRILRGSPHGLGLFLVQTVVHAHGGQALARRSADGALTVDLLFS